MRVSLGISLVIFSFLALKVYATDYCRAGLCQNGGPHIGCNNKGAFAPACPKGKKLVDMANFKTTILNMHNAIRNKTAAGNTAKHSSAVRMASMTWDKELEYLAGLNVKRCIFGHDKCRSTDAFKYSGQNLAGRWVAPKQYPKDMVRIGVNLWIKEKANCDMTYINSFHGAPKEIGHWTVMMVESNNKVGCAIVQFPQDKGIRMIMACNYAGISIKDRPIYTAGPTASKCTTGRHAKYTALCSASEKYT